jgi:hypothetical protein
MVCVKQVKPRPTAPKIVEQYNLVAMVCVKQVKPRPTALEIVEAVKLPQLYPAFNH